MAYREIEAGITMSPYVNKISITKTKRNPELQKYVGRIVGNNILSRYLTLNFLKNIPISTRQCIMLIGIVNY